MRRQCRRFKRRWLVADRRTLSRWISRGTWAVADQALFACSNFVVTIALARWLSAVEYGAFVTSYAVFLIVSMIHAGLITDPLVVFGSDRYAPWFSQYLRRVIREHFLMTAAASVPIAVAAVVLWSFDQHLMAVALFGVACVSPFILLAQVTRRACYANVHPGWAAFSGFVNLAVVVAGLWVLNVGALLSVVGAQALMGLAAIASSLSVLPALYRLTKGPVPAHELASVRRVHVRFGRWTAASGFLSWTTTQGCYVWLAMWGGLTEAASLRALLNFILPILHMDLAVAGLLVPALVRRRDEPRRFRRILYLAVGAFTLEALGYGVVLVTCGAWAMHLVYGGTYSADTWLLVLVAAIPLATSLVNTFSSGLKALERPRSVFHGTLSGALIMLTIGMVATRQWGSAGAIAGMLGSLGVQGVLLGKTLWSATAYRTNSPEVSSPNDFHSDSVRAPFIHAQ
jgi:O-antigen/teichoic acid export membrane protein